MLGMPNILRKSDGLRNAICIRLGEPVWGDSSDPDQWINLLRNEGYTAAYCPVEVGTDQATVRSFENPAKKAGIVISEVGAWSNPFSKDEKVRKEAIQKCKDSMPWIFPDSPDSYLDLIKAIDRKQFGVHLDPVNMISSPRRYYSSGAFIKECFDKLGPYIKNCHAKDILLHTNLTVHLDEVLMGTAGLDYKVYLTELSKLNNVPLMLEHLKTKEEYKQAASHVRKVGESIGIRFC